MMLAGLRASPMTLNGSPVASTAPRRSCSGRYPIAVTTVSAGISCSWPLTSVINPFGVVCRALASAITVMPRNGTKRRSISSLATHSGALWVRILASASMIVTSASTSLIARASSQPVNPPPMMTILLPKALRLSRASVASMTFVSSPRLSRRGVDPVAKMM